MMHYQWGRFKDLSLTPCHFCTTVAHFFSAWDSLAPIQIIGRVESIGVNGNPVPVSRLQHEFQSFTKCDYFVTNHYYSTSVAVVDPEGCVEFRLDALPEMRTARPVPFLLVLYRFPWNDVRSPCYFKVQLPEKLTAKDFVDDHRLLPDWSRPCSLDRLDGSGHSMLRRMAIKPAAAMTVREK